MSDCSLIYITPNESVLDYDYGANFTLTAEDSVELFAHYEKRCSDHKPLKVRWYKNDSRYGKTESKESSDYYFTSRIMIYKPGSYRVALIAEDESEQSGCGMVTVKFIGKRE